MLDSALVTATPYHTAIPVGTRLGKYEVMSLLGCGGMAEIYLARAHEAAGVTQRVVIKRVLPQLVHDPEFVRMFVEEAKITALLDHPNIARVKEVGRASGEFFLALEYVHGVDLRQILRKRSELGGFPRALALTIIAAVADALHHAHGHGVVHRDVSPSNVMVSHDGHVKVLDFGIAKATRTAMTRAGTIKGKVGYMSPEQCMAEDVDCRTDVFALGILLYELTVGRRLFRGDSDFAVMNQITLGRFAIPSSIEPDYPPALESIVLRALALEPNDRFQTARDLAAAVEGFALSQQLRLSPGIVADWMQEAFGDPQPLTAPTGLSNATRPSQVIATRWSYPSRTKRSRPLAIGLLAGALGIAVGAVAVAGLKTSPARVESSAAPVAAAESHAAPLSPRAEAPIAIGPPRNASAVPVATPPAAAVATRPAASAPATRQAVPQPTATKRKKPKKTRAATTKKPTSESPLSDIFPPSRRPS